MSSFLGNIASALKRDLTQHRIYHAPHALEVHLPSWDAPADQIQLVIRPCPANPDARWDVYGTWEREGVTRVEVEVGCLDLEGSNSIQSSNSKSRRGVNTMIDYLRKIDTWDDLADNEWTACCATKSTTLDMILGVTAHLAKGGTIKTAAYIKLAVKYADEPALDLNPHLFTGRTKPM